MTTQTTSPDAVSEHDRWRAERLQALTAPQGNLALVDTRWYEPGAEVPVEDLVATAAVTITRLERVDAVTGLPQYGLRRWDPESARARDFRGIDVYPYDPAWVIEATWVPRPDGNTVAFEHLHDNGRAREHAVPGEIAVTIAGHDYSLQAMGDGDVLMLVFADATNGTETYGTGRFLYVERDGDAVALDFNRAFVPPCGFSDHFNCPLPPAANRIQSPVRAGERRPLFGDQPEH